MVRGDIIVSCMIIIIDIVAKERLGLGTVLNVLLVGIFMDMVAALNFIPTPESFAMRFAFLIIGTVILAFGCLLYIGVGFGAGPRDSMMVVAMRVSNRSMMVCRLCIEITVCFVGYLLGGTVGVGTVILAIITGPMISPVFKIFGVDAKKIPHTCFYTFGIYKTSV